jgi:hypothetical protein
MNKKSFQQVLGMMVMALGENIEITKEVFTK